MQVTTTTITTENTTAAGVNFQVKVYEQNTTAFCDCCPNQSTATKPQLINQGWYLGQNEQFCPECNY